MHIKEQAKVITENVSSAKQDATLLLKHSEKLGLDEIAIELIADLNKHLQIVTNAIRGEEQI